MNVRRIGLMTLVAGLAAGPASAQVRASQPAVLEIARANEKVLSDAIMQGGAKHRMALLPAVAHGALAPAVLACLEDGSAEVRVSAWPRLHASGR